MTPRKEEKKLFHKLAPAAAAGIFLVTMPLYCDAAVVSLITDILVFALLVMSLDLLVGYAGLFSFGHAAFFGIGAYAVAILANHYNITNFWLAVPVGIVVATFSAALFGLIALRVSGIYFLLITIALGELVHGIVQTSVGWLGAITGGSDGLGGIAYPVLFGFSLESTSYYYMCFVVFIICAALLYLITSSPFGYALQSIRDDDIRASALGYNTWLYQYLAYIIGGFFAGVAGVLYVYYNGLASPQAVGLDNSGLLWLMLIIGGSGTMWGGLIGSAIILSLQYFVSGFTPERWPLVLGVCFVGVIMFFRGGLFLPLSNLWKKVGND